MRAARYLSATMERNYGLERDSRRNDCANERARVLYDVVKEFCAAA